MEQLVVGLITLLIFVMIGIGPWLARTDRRDLKINLEQHNLKHLLTPLWSAFGNTVYSSISPAALEKHGIGTSKERELLQDVLGINDRIASEDSESKSAKSAETIFKQRARLEARQSEARSLRGNLTGSWVGKHREKGPMELVFEADGTVVLIGDGGAEATSANYSVSGKLEGVFLDVQSSRSGLSFSAGLRMLADGRMLLDFGNWEMLLAKV